MSGEFSFSLSRARARVSLSLARARATRARSRSRSRSLARSLLSRSRSLARSLSPSMYLYMSIYLSSYLSILTQARPRLQQGPSSADAEPARFTNRHCTAGVSKVRIVNTRTFSLYYLSIYLTQARPRLQQGPGLTQCLHLNRDCTADVIKVRTLNTRTSLESRISLSLSLYYLSIYLTQARPRLQQVPGLKQSLRVSQSATAQRVKPRLDRHTHISLESLSLSIYLSISRKHAPISQQGPGFVDIEAVWFLIVIVQWVS